MREQRINLPGLRTGVLGRQTICLPSVGSTNDYIKKHARALKGGAAVYTLRQTAGRGRRGNTWKGDDGRSLALSVLLRPAPTRALPVLPLCCGLAAAQALEDITGGDFYVKWPNDVLCGGRKLAGILCESFVLDGASAAVLGIGVNLAGTLEEFLAAGLPHAGSLFSQTGHTPAPETAISEMLNRLEEEINACVEGGFPAIQARFEKKCLTLGRTVRVVTGDGERTGVAAGLAPDGTLLVDCGGERIPVRSGEASVRGLYGYV